MLEKKCDSLIVVQRVIVVWISRCMCMFKSAHTCIRGARTHYTSHLRDAYPGHGHNGTQDSSGALNIDFTSATDIMVCVIYIFTPRLCRAFWSCIIIGEIQQIQINGVSLTDTINAEIQKALQGMKHACVPIAIQSFVTYKLYWL